MGEIRCHFNHCKRFYVRFTITYNIVDDFELTLKVVSVENFSLIGKYNNIITNEKCKLCVHYIIF